MTVKKSDSFCPKGALVATGPVNSYLGGNQPHRAGGTPCNPFLHVWNGGHGTLWFFFTTGGKYQCAGLKTGATAAYPGHISEHGKNMVTNVPLPPDVSTSVAHIPTSMAPDQGSPHFKNLKTKFHHKTIGINGRSAARPASARTACSSRRPPPAARRRRPSRAAPSAELKSFPPGVAALRGAGAALP